jgi:hypothetical protein
MSDGSLSVDVPTNVTLKIPEEANFVMRERDWARVRKRVDSLGKKRRELSAVAWACVGVLVSAVFALLAWMPAYATLSDAARIEFAWVLPATIALGALGLLLGGGMFWGAHLIGSDERLTASQIVEEMDDIHPIVA